MSFDTPLNENDVSPTICGGAEREEKFPPIEFEEIGGI
jgi:hypothetical protein